MIDNYPPHVTTPLTLTLAINMKKIIILALTTFLFFSSIFFIRGYMTQQVVLKNISLAVKDFVPPEKVTLEQTAMFTNRNIVNLSWNSVDDYENTSEPVSYILEINGKEKKVEQNSLVLDISNFLEGNYQYRVKSCDSLENCSNWSDSGLLTIDRTIPEYSLLFLDNPLAESALHFSTQGDVYNNHSGEWLISNLENDNYWFENNLLIESNQLLSPFLYFEYKTNSNEYLSGFDQTKLIVTINEKIVFVESEIKEDWQKVFLDLSQYYSSTVKIEISSGNQGDELEGSMAIVRNISSEILPVSKIDDIEIVSEEKLFSVSKKINNGYLDFSVQDQSGNQEIRKILVSEGKLIGSSDKHDLVRELGIVR